MTGCDVTSSFLGLGKRTVCKRVQKSTESHISLTQLLHEDLKFATKHIYKD